MRGWKEDTNSRHTEKRFFFHTVLLDFSCVTKTGERQGKLSDYSFMAPYPHPPSLSLSLSLSFTHTGYVNRRRGRCSITFFEEGRGEEKAGNAIWPDMIQPAAS